MKQTDKCECEHKRKEHILFYMDGRGKCKICNCRKFKSHSQSLPERLERPVRASEEVIRDGCNVEINPQGVKVKTMSSSVPYTPLIKEDILTVNSDNPSMWLLDYNKTLFALNGLREELRQEGYGYLLDKWFPILEDSGDEKK